MLEDLLILFFYGAGITQRIMTIRRKEVNIMFTKMAIGYLRKRIVEIDDENEMLKANAFLNLIEQFLKKKK